MGTPRKPSGTTLEPGTAWNSSVTHLLSQTLAWVVWQSRLAMCAVAGSFSHPPFYNF